MPTGRQGSIHLFQFRGIDVFLHWSWFLIAVIEINARSGRYSSIAWNVLEYLALFVIVLVHEFGHALACRQVGGRANRIVLWPLGGVAYVDPPPRPGATLWSIAAGPLVNVALLPVLWGAALLVVPLHIANVGTLLYSVAWINTVLLIFNVLPIYPLDGGQILRSLLWFWMGRARSLMVATILGFVGAAIFVLYAIRERSTWLLILAAYMVLNCWGGMKQALFLTRMSKLERRPGYACPNCGSAPPVGVFWRCGHCRTKLDTFEWHAQCPNCSTQFPLTRCIDCGGAYPISQWVAGPPTIPATFVTNAGWPANGLQSEKS